MTKKLLLEILENTTLKFDPNPSKKEIYDKYCRPVLTLLSVLPDNVQINGVDCLKQSVFSDKTSFENFIRGNIADIEYTLHSLIDQLTIWTENYIRIHTDEAKVLSNKSRKTHVGTIAFLSIIIPTVIAAIIFLILDIASIISYGDKVSTVIGCIDFLCGVGFFLYEFLSDREKADVSKNAELHATEGDYAKFYNIYEKDIKNSYNCLCGCRNDVGDKNSHNDTESFKK